MIRNLLGGIPIALLVLLMPKEQIELQIVLLTYFRSIHNVTVCSHNYENYRVGVLRAHS